MANHIHNSHRPARKSVIDAVARGDIQTVIYKLTARQRRFCEEYSIDFNGGAAAIRAGYSPKNAQVQATNLMMNVGVLAYIDHLTMSKEAKITAVDPDYIIQQVTAIIGKTGAKDSDRLRGLELLARHLGMFIERTEITGKDGGPIESRQVEQDAQSFTNLLKTLADRAEKVEPETKKV